jgi:hypothetical protein
MNRRDVILTSAKAASAGLRETNAGFVAAAAK